MVPSDGERRATTSLNMSTGMKKVHVLTERFEVQRRKVQDKVIKLAP